MFRKIIFLYLQLIKKFSINIDRKLNDHSVINRLKVIERFDILPKHIDIALDDVYGAIRMIANTKNF